MWQRFIIGVAQGATWLARALGTNGTALPGLIIERLSPNLLGNLAAKLPEGVIVVTGTNGKTTTAKILRHLLEQRGLKVLANRSGSNFTRGIIATFAQHARLSGVLPYDVAVIEIDEAYTPQLAKQLKPRQLVVLNVMRDQLDRYGEIDHTAQLIGSAIKYCSSVVLNADDPPVANLSNLVTDSSAVSYFGAASAIQKQLPSDDELIGPKVTNLTKNPKANVLLLAVKAGDNTTALTLKVNSDKYTSDFNLEGVHNALNAAAAIASLHQLFGLKSSDIARLAEVKPAFGRGERLDIDGVTVHLALIKNPAGFNQNVRSFVKPTINQYLIAINDRYADGRDVSWLWDVDLSSLPKDANYVVSGIRCYDMALRLQYEGIENIQTDTNLNRALETAISRTSAGSELLILPTYTAMLDIRKTLSKKTETDKIWK